MIYILFEALPVAAESPSSDNSQNGSVTSSGDKCIQNTHFPRICAKSKNIHDFTFLLNTFCMGKLIATSCVIFNPSGSLQPRNLPSGYPASTPARFLLLPILVSILPSCRNDNRVFLYSAHKTIVAATRESACRHSHDRFTPPQTANSVLLCIPTQSHNDAVQPRNGIV